MYSRIDLIETFSAFDETVEYLNEKNIVKMDKATAKKRLARQSTLFAAKKANDPLYTKYVKYTKLRKEYREAIQAKYGAKGKQLMKMYIKQHASEKLK